MSSPRLRAALTLFWALWLSVVTLTNVTNGLRTAGVLPTTFAFASDNLQLIETTTSVYEVPRAATWLLFAAVIVWEATAAALLYRAAARLRRGDGAGVEAAYAAALGLFAAFMLADELLLAYPLQGGHARFFIALGVSLLLVRHGEPSREPRPAAAPLP